MIRRLWLVICLVWTAFWVFLYIIGTQGLTPTEQASQRASTTVMMAIPWIIGVVMRWIVTGSRRRSQ